MKLGDAFPGNWLKSSDLGDEDHAVTIKEVRQKMVGQGKDQQLKLVMDFDEMPKGLILNKTNASTISKVLGSEDTDDWIGKRVVLWVNPDVQFGGEVVSAIRVRNKPAPKPISKGVLDYKAAVQLCADHGIGEDVLKEHLKATGLTKYNPAVCTPVVRQFVASLEAPPSDADDDIPF